ncbi:uncharacterized protein LOC119070139 [Bradysia coprophila]|uniref:uncharacterized protein LOC119070139 n=1 Tax=Bradysia coprophila TaxID=38358 RepID=UPI00187D8F1A|nr:uncharacterized protein LOC119070139 [Bradysia coprophila]
MMRKLFLLLCAVWIVSSQRTHLIADGNSAGTYGLLNRILGGTANSPSYEVPDCVHPIQHITQQVDTELGAPVFVFHSHVDLDNDRCRVFDRLRTEIKTHNPSPDFLKGFYGETVSYSWDFKLDAQFQPATSFTHIFQVKAVGGEDSQPFITITPRLTSVGTTLLQLIHSGFNSAQSTIWQGPLANFLGRWIHVEVEYLCAVAGRFHMTMTRKDTGQQLMTFTSNNIEMWRTGNTFQRPKWGVYRSLNNRASLRDERAFFNNFCLAKHPYRCITN